MKMPKLTIRLLENATHMGVEGAKLAAARLRQVLEERGEARLVVATGASQFELFRHLVEQEVDWSKIDGFHLDEYVGIEDTHPASFVRYLRERFVSKVPLRSFRYLDGSRDAATECQQAGQAIQAAPIDLLLCGIGENGHLAFNDPPADFTTTEPYLRVRLDEACRHQQVGEGWFPDLDSVPQYAISMSIQQILSARSILCSVPDARKAVAVQHTLLEPISPLHPASILRRHPDTTLLIDQASATLLPESLRSQAAMPQGWKVSE